MYCEIICIHNKKKSWISSVNYIHEVFCLFTETSLINNTISSYFDAFLFSKFGNTNLISLTVAQYHLGLYFYISCKAFHHSISEPSGLGDRLLINRHTRLRSQVRDQMSTLCVIEVPKCEGCHLLSEMFEDTKGIIISRKSKDRQHNGQKKKDKRTNHDLQNITYKTKDRVTRTPLKTGANSGVPEG